MNRIKFLKKKLFFWLIPIFIILFTLAFTSIKIFILKKNVDNEIIAKNNFNRTMIVVADIDYEPYSFINEKGEPAGHDIELISAIANKMKYNLDIRLMKWKDCIETAITGKAQVILLFVLGESSINQYMNFMGKNLQHLKIVDVDQNF